MLWLPVLCSLSSAGWGEVFDQVLDEHRPVGLAEVLHDLGSDRVVNGVVLALIEGDCLGLVDRQVTVPRGAVLLCCGQSVATGVAGPGVAVPGPSPLESLLLGHVVQAVVLGVVLDPLA